MSEEVRIIGGQWRGRRLHFPALEGLRPTPNRVRETLFNWLGQDMTGLRCLDLFAGSGALGFEALSRGAERVVMVEKARPAVQALMDNKARLDARGAEVVGTDALRWLSVTQERFHVVFLDPPFDTGLMDILLPRMQGFLEPGGWLYCETPQGVSESSLWKKIRSSRAGQVTYQLFQSQGDDAA